MPSLVEQLKAEIETRKVLVVVGAGVSVGATAGDPRASWTGLLKHGADFCTDLHLSPDGGWKDRIYAQIDTGDITEMTSAAQNVADRLGAPNGGDFKKWLRQSVGSLDVSDDSTIQAIIELNLPIATTNYDSLLTNASSLPPVVWTNTSSTQRWWRDDHDGVLHLHGHWEFPESVVLGVRSYDDILRDEATQSLLKNLVYTNTLLFVGFGSGLTDPNFAALLKWSQRILAGSEYNHFRLVLDSKVDDARTEHQNDRIRVIGIGNNYSDLPGFLRSLCASPGPASSKPKIRESQVQALTEGRVDLLHRKALLDAEKATLSPDEYTEKLADIVENLVRIGGVRSAVRMLFSHISKSYESLSFGVRTAQGLVLVELLLTVGDYKFAMDTIRTLHADCTKTDAPPEVAEKFWRLSASACGARFAYEDAAISFENALEHCKDGERRIDIEAEQAEFQFLRGVLPDADSGGKTV